MQDCVDADQSVAMEHREVGLSESEAFELVTGFRPYGFWRMELDTGHVYATEGFFRIYDMVPHPGPLDVVEVASRIHADDLPHLLRTFEQAGCEKPVYRSIFRVKTCADHFKFVQAIGRFRAKPGAAGEVVGITYELASDSAQGAMLLEKALQRHVDLSIQH